MKKYANQLFKSNSQCRKYFFYTNVRENKRFLTRSFLHRVEKKRNWKTFFSANLLLFTTIYGFALIDIADILFRNKRFMLDEMCQQNASKFAILLEYKNPCWFFRFSFRAIVLYFFPNVFPGLLMYVSLEHFIKHKHLISEECR